MLPTGGFTNIGADFPITKTHQERPNSDLIELKWQVAATFGLEKNPVYF